MAGTDGTGHAEGQDQGKDRYRRYLRGYGIGDAGDRVIVRRDLDAGGVRFFAYGDDQGVRFKAALTSTGQVSPGGGAGDDWYGFLSALPDAAVAAARLAWLETDESRAPHVPVRTPVVVLVPDRRPPTAAAAINPSEWSLVSAPERRATSDGAVALTAWLLPGGATIPERWTVSAGPSVAATVTRVSARDLSVAAAGGAAAAAARDAATARRVLASGTDDERTWALQHVADSGDRAAVPAVSALLADAGASATTRLLAAGALGRLGDGSAVAPLGVALRIDPAPEVRRACAQALGRIAGAEATRPLAEAAPAEPEAAVRAEIVEALGAHGSPARAALAALARSDPDAAVRSLAQAKLSALKD